MNLVKFWQDTIDKYNLTNKCGFCWQFGAPLTKSALNMSDPQQCCVNVFFTDFAFEKSINYCDYNFNLWVLVPSDLGTNNYNEKQGYAISDSNWEKIYLPLFNCIGCGFDAEFCSTLGYSLEIIKWRGSQVADNKFDENYKGFMIQATFRKNE